jgi:hypothetical protein
MVNVTYGSLQETTGGESSFNPFGTDFITTVNDEVAGESKALSTKVSTDNSVRPGRQRIRLALRSAHHFHGGSGDVPPAPTKTAYS